MIDAINTTLEVALSAKGKIATKIDDTNGEIQKLQGKAIEVDSANQGKMKKLQRKSKFLMDKLKDFERLEALTDATIALMRRRRLDHDMALKIRGRARVSGGEMYFEQREDAVIMSLLGHRKVSEALEVRQALEMLSALPKEFRD